MSSSWGNNIKISIFGESHGPAIGVVMDGLPPGFELDMDELLGFMARRAPGKSPLSTPRKESDIPEILSGLYNSFTTGTPLCAVIRNTNTKSADYADISGVARPAHADFTGFLRYKGYNDNRGGGHFSGRLTAPLVFAGGVAKQILTARGIFIGAYIASIKNVLDGPPDCISRELLEAIASKPFPVFDDARGEKMKTEIEKARLDGDSVGGVISCAVFGMPAGIGSPMFGGVENIAASLLFGIPGIKGVEFGSGFGGTELYGSENNDAMRYENDAVISETNNHGGVLGGITGGMPITVRVAVKPTPSIAKTQRTVDYVKRENAEINIHGRHDPCIVPRAVPCVEACMALAALELLAAE